VDYRLKVDPTKLIEMLGSEQSKFDESVLLSKIVQCIEMIEDDKLTDLRTKKARVHEIILRLNVRAEQLIGTSRLNAALYILNSCERLETARKMYAMLSLTFMNLGLYHRRMQDEPNSLYTLKRAKQLAEESDEVEFMGSILLNLSAVQIQMGYMDEGLESAKKSLIILTRSLTSALPQLARKTIVAQSPNPDKRHSHCQLQHSHSLSETTEIQERVPAL